MHELVVNWCRTIESSADLRMHVLPMVVYCFLSDSFFVCIFKRPCIKGYSSLTSNESLEN